MIVHAAETRLLREARGKLAPSLPDCSQKGRRLFRFALPLQYIGKVDPEIGPFAAFSQRRTEFMFGAGKIARLQQKVPEQSVNVRIGCPASDHITEDIHGFVALALAIKDIGQGGAKSSDSWIFLAGDAELALRRSQIAGTL
jgi:hypothetical protein